MYPVTFTYRGEPVVAVVQAYAASPGMSGAAGLPWLVSVSNRAVQETSVLVIAFEAPAETIGRLVTWLDQRAPPRRRAGATRRR